MTVGHLEIAVIAKKEETVTEQIKRQLLFTWNSSQKE
jgi:hypothetical protein